MSKNATKGQWKLLARLQGQQGIGQELKIVDSLGDMNRKREKDENEEEAEVARLNPSEKKEKATKMGKSLNNIEVEKTSLNWSRLNR